MKQKTKALMIGFFIIVSAVSLHASTSITGAFGHLTIPTTNTPARGTVNVHTGYIFTPGNFFISVNTALLPRWELSAGKEIRTARGVPLGSTPYIFGTKYMFYGSRKGGFRAALGLQLELLEEGVGASQTAVSLYGLISENAGKIGYINTGLGYTFGMDAGYRINFSFGLRKALIGEQLFGVAEFTNYSIRQGLERPWSEGRGIFNGGLELQLTDFFRFKLMGYDLFDNFLTVGLGGEVAVKAF